MIEIDRNDCVLVTGASGFVGKDAPSEDVITAARHAIVAPATFTASGLVEAMLRRRNAPGPRLTEREAEVLALLAEGLGVAQIAQSLYVAESTAKAHISKIYEKLGAANRAQALMTALRLGLLPDPNA